MPLTKEELLTALDAVEEQWNTAEEFMKRVEGLGRGEVVGPSVNELRYAGRRLVDAYSILKNETLNAQAKKEAELFLSEAKSFCMKAQHDAIDAAVTFIDRALYEFELKVDSVFIQAHFTSYKKLKKEIRKSREAMSQSRKDRTQRASLYSQISTASIEEIIELFLDLDGDKPEIHAAFTRQVTKDKRDGFRIWAGIFVAAAVALIVGFKEEIKQALNGGNEVNQSLEVKSKSKTSEPDVSSPK